MPDLYSGFYIVASSSMSPVLKPGDRIFIEPAGNAEIKPGLVVVFNSPEGKKIVHRIVKRSGYLIQTSGDSNRRLDKPVHIYDVIGKVKGIEIAEPLSKLRRNLRAFKRRIFKWL